MTLWGCYPEYHLLPCNFKYPTLWGVAAHPPSLTPHPGLFLIEHYGVGRERLDIGQQSKSPKKPSGPNDIVPMELSRSPSPGEGTSLGVRRRRNSSESSKDSRRPWEEPRATRPRDTSRRWSIFPPPGRGKGGRCTTDHGHVVHLWLEAQMIFLLVWCFD